MKNLFRRISAFVFSFILVSSLLPATSVWAKTSSYTVKFRAGDVNTFNQKVLSEYGIEGEENFFSIKVEADKTIREALGNYLAPEHADSVSNEQITMFFERILNENATYMLNEVSSWCEDLDAVLAHNESYVLDYAKLVNPIKYTVYFLDTEDESQIAMPWIRYVDADMIGTTVTIEPLLVSRYATTNTAVKLTLTEDNNQEVRFYYAYVGEYVHVPSGAEGEVIYNDIIELY